MKLGALLAFLLGASTIFFVGCGGISPTNGAVDRNESTGGGTGGGGSTGGSGGTSGGSSGMTTGTTDTTGTTGDVTTGTDGSSGTTGDDTTGSDGSTSGSTTGTSGGDEIHADLSDIQARTLALSAKPGTVTWSFLGLESAEPAYFVGITRTDGTEFVVVVHGNSGVIIRITEDSGGSTTTTTGGS